MRDRRRLHFSWLLTLFSGSFIVGVIAARSISLFTIWIYILLILGIVLSSLAVLSRGRLAPVFLIIFGGLLLGCYRGTQYKQTLALYEYYRGKSVQITGRIFTDPERVPQGGTRIRLTSVEVNGLPAGGTIWVTTHEAIDFKRSDVVGVKGVLSEGFGTVPATMYRADALSVTRRKLSDPGRSMRDRFSEAVRLGIKDPEAALANGFLVGAQTSLPEKLDADLKLLGLSHIVVASGYNLTILVRFARRLFSRVSRFASLVAALLLVLVFMNITGFSPSMVRAAIVVVLSLLAWYYGRKVHPLTLLFLSAGISVLLQPSYAWGDVGWLLSFGSFVGVLILGPLLHSYFWHKKSAGFVRQLLIETLAAYIVTLPLVIFIFNRFSPLAIVANMVVLPLISPVMALTFIGGSVSLLLPWLAKIVAYPAQLLLQYVTTIVGWLSDFPMASKEASFSAISVCASYVFMCLFMLFLWRRSGHDFRDFNVIE